ncbi:MAG: 1-acyl-sn-glycerol-3-phosphate acyltransferase [Halothiobacillaceae bacterium]|nr:MAG: 1-acyl-sn-glycerol-3-phosphate acyltransferase [Halothiobacillaceae bacterium]
MAVYLRSLVFFIGQAVSVVAVAMVGLLLFPLPFEIRYRVISRWALFNLWWLKVTCHLSFEVEGREHIPDKAAIVFCKHQSTWETLALQAILPPQIWLLKRELLWIPFFGWGLALLEPIAIDRKAGREAIKQLINQGKKRLSDGRWVIIFPEGTRVPPGEHREFKLGGAMLAERAQAPV